MRLLLLGSVQYQAMSSRRLLILDIEPMRISKKRDYERRGNKITPPSAVPMERHGSESEANVGSSR
jgi:hypothetical protein